MSEKKRTRSRSIEVMDLAPSYGSSDKKTFWVAVGSLAAIGMLIVVVGGILVDDSNPQPPRLNIICEEHPVAGLQIRSNLSGNWNQSAVAENGDVVLDAEYSQHVTPISLYTEDRKTCLGNTTVDFTRGRRFLQIHFEARTVRE